MDFEKAAGTRLKKFGEAVRTCLKKYTDDRGRARRSEYWYFVLLNALVLLTILVVCGIVIGVAYLLASSEMMYDDTVVEAAFTVGAVVYVLYALAVAVPFLAVSVRRLHDLNASGCYLLVFFLVGLIPYIGIISAIAQIIIFAQQGTEGENKYGPDPLQVDSPSPAL
jgi:uncharacterized membrane protein YhaH (DUF805 family)